MKQIKDMSLTDYRIDLKLPLSDYAQWFQKNLNRPKPANIDKWELYLKSKK